MCYAEDVAEPSGGEKGVVKARGRVWVVGEEGVAAVLKKTGECVLLGERENGREDVVCKLQQLLAGLTWLVPLLTPPPFISISTSHGTVVVVPLDTDWSHITSSPLLLYVESAVNTHTMAVAQVILHRQPLLSSSHEAS